MGDELKRKGVFHLTYPSMRSSFFEFIDYYFNKHITILSGFRLNIHQTEKSEFGEKASRAFFRILGVRRGSAERSVAEAHSLLELPTHSI